MYILRPFVSVAPRPTLKTDPSYSGDLETAEVSDGVAESLDVTRLGNGSIGMIEEIRAGVLRPVNLNL